MKTKPGILLIYDENHKNWSEDREERETFIKNVLERVNYECPYYACGPIWLSSVLEEFKKYGFDVSDEVIESSRWTFGWFIDEWPGAITDYWYPNCYHIVISGFRYFNGFTCVDKNVRSILFD